jgi:hypothetical protein
MEGIAEPVAAPLERQLRRAVLQLVSGEPRRRFPTVLHVGWPTGRQARFTPDRTPDGALDQALRADVVAALVRRAGGAATTPLVWLARCGDLELADADADWLAAARAAYAEAGSPLTMVVVTRQGWRDPRSGATRRWRRLRDRSRDRSGGPP